ncbi:sugar transferase [Rugosimonospora africana]|uniref:Polyprenyl glycosylphosphotransferase n=1 Tax=Rugosimonospora africana TaxID=556532 RepID=A0A8J3VP61_9ACTN|nr:sugar transferase [Rugosimonospora africana]GIH12943.1 polyprenyl glycosylphosphotransferase [Rugosimonospora africana]
MTTIVSTSSTAVDHDTTVTVTFAPLDLPNQAGFARTGWETRYVRALLLLDLLVGMIAAGVALISRFGSSVNESYNRDYLWFTLALPFAWLLALTIYRAFEPRYLFVGNDEYERVFRAGVGLTAALAIFSFTFDLRLARGYIVIAMPLAIVCALSARYLMRRRLHAAWARGERLRRVILVGHEQAAHETTRQLRRERYHGMGVVGVCLPAAAGAQGELVQRLPGLPPVYGSFEEVAQAVQRAHADTVVVLSCPELDGTALRRLAWKLERDDIDLIVASTLVDVAGDRTTIRPVDGLPLLHVEHPRLKGGRRVFKEIFDRVASLFGLLLLLPLVLAVAVLIKTTPGRPGPVIFRQTRVGRNGRTFVMYKFRTMYRDAEARLVELRHLNETGGSLFKMRDDPRVTPVGRWLRKLSIDEVPQLINVVKGDMSLVGPRPPLPREVAEYPFDMRRRLVVKPGLTGLWQVSGRSDLTWEESIRLDLQYVENWSFAMDVMILARTVIAVWRSAGAY